MAKKELRDFDKTRHLVRQSLIRNGIRLKQADPIAHKLTFDLVNIGVIDPKILKDVRDDELAPKQTKEK